jgi:hypothetical protein
MKYEIIFNTEYFFVSKIETFASAVNNPNSESCNDGIYGCKHITDYVLAEHNT